MVMNGMKRNGPLRKLGLLALLVAGHMGVSLNVVEAEVNYTYSSNEWPSSLIEPFVCGF